MEIPLKSWDKDILEIMDPLSNMDKIYDKHNINAKNGHEEIDDIDHRGQHVIELKREWIRKPFHMDPII